LVSAARPIFFGSPSVIANRWFADNERTQAQALQNINTALGSSLAYILSGVYFRDLHKDTIECLKGLVIC